MFNHNHSSYFCDCGVSRRSCVGRKQGLQVCVKRPPKVHAHSRDDVAPIAIVAAEQRDATNIAAASEDSAEDDDGEALPERAVLALARLGSSSHHWPDGAGSTSSPTASRAGSSSRYASRSLPLPRHVLLAGSDTFTSDLGTSYRVEGFARPRKGAVSDSFGARDTSALVLTSRASAKENAFTYRVTYEDGDAEGK